MPSHAENLRSVLALGPASARQLIEKIGITQSTLSRALSSMGEEVLRLGNARSMQYALRDSRRGLQETPIYRVGADGRITRLGVLIPVRPEGFVMRQDDGLSRHSHGLPWWLSDMRPQGFLGRAYAARHAEALGLPTRLTDWNDTHALQALIAHGHDAMGNLLLGDGAREHFLNAPALVPIPADEKGAHYARLAQEAIRGERPGSSAGGEQPKFTSFVDAATGPCHVLVKFTLPDDNAVTERWRDLLLAEHHALETLSAGGCVAARSSIVDHGGQRFLEVERFDRTGALGRRGLFSLAAVEAEFVGDASSPWPVLVQRLANDGHIAREAARSAALLFAFGTLIGNTDMHPGNLSFTSEQGRPYWLAPAYDMLPMGFAPSREGGLPIGLNPLNLQSCVSNEIWFKALKLSRQFMVAIRSEERFSPAFGACLNILRERIETAAEKMARLG